MIDLTGKRFGKLVVIGEGDRIRTPGQVRRTWSCECDCGESAEVVQYHLTKGYTRSCGCLRSENDASLTHGQARGMAKSAAWRVWAGLKARCYNPKSRGYKWYGAKGVTICDRWIHSFQNFHDDMGDRPQGRSLDRVDGSKNYSPDNCRWATSVEQAVNKSSVILYRLRGKELCLKHWASDVGMSYLKLYKRVVMCGWELERALSE